MSVSKKSTGWHWNPRRRAAAATSDWPVDQPSSTAVDLLEVVLPYDAWCLRTARSESAKALMGLCAPDVLNQLLLVITELVMISTIDSRDECTLSVHRIDDEVVIVVRNLSTRSSTHSAEVGTIESGMGTMHSTTTQYRVEQELGRRDVRARFSLVGRSSNRE